MASRPKKINVKPSRKSSCEILSSNEEAELSLSSTESPLSISRVQIHDGGRLLNRAGKTSENTVVNGHPINAFEVKELPRSKERCCSLYGHFHVVLLYIVTVIAIATLGLVVLAVFGMVDVCKCTNEVKRAVDPVSNMEKDVALLWKSLNATTKQLNLINSSNIVHNLQQKVRNITAKLSAMESLITRLQHNSNGSDGASGSPGSPGPAGPPGLTGPQGATGPKGGGNMTLCLYKSKKKGVTKSKTANTDISVAQTRDKKILGVSCSTDGAAQYVLTSFSFPSLTYKCHCKGQSELFKSAGDMFCYIHYWECPLVS